MKRIMQIVLALGLIMGLMYCTGCKTTQQVRDDLVSWSESDIKNVETMRLISDNLRETWPFYSGLIDGFYELISHDALEKKTALDKIYGTDDWDDRAAGQALALRARLVYELTQQGVDELLPGFLDLVKPFI